MTSGTRQQGPASSGRGRSKNGTAQSRPCERLPSRLSVLAATALLCVSVSVLPCHHRLGPSPRWMATTVVVDAFAAPPPPGGSGRSGRRHGSQHRNHRGGGEGGSDGGGTPPPLPPGSSAWDLFDGNGGGGGEDAPTDPARERRRQANATASSESRIARGGGAGSGGPPSAAGGKRPNRNDAVLEGGRTVLARAAQFWTAAVEATAARIGGAFLRSDKSQKKEQELLEQLQTMPVRRVSVPNSTVLPPEVIRMAVKRSGLVGSPLRTDRVQEFAKNLKRWYVRQGYVLHSVTGATLRPESATAEITVEEPVVSRMPVQIVVCKEMVVDDETGETMTLRQYYKRKQEEGEKQRGIFGGGGGRNVAAAPDKQGLNTTLVTTKARTRASQVARALRLQPGQPFRWSDERWRKIATSGVFSKVLRAAPERTSDGGVCLQVFAMEPPARHLEYGIGKSIWTNSWEGEVDFDWRNLFGGGESIGVLVRRGTKDAAPSVRVKYGDDKFGLEGGYGVEVFSDFLGDTAKAPPIPGDERDGRDGEATAPGHIADELDQDFLLNRRGAIVRLRNPISPNLIANSVASACVERTSTTTGHRESIGSATLTLGPFRRLLPMDARTSIASTFTGGTRFRGAPDGPGSFTGSLSTAILGDDVRGGGAGSLTAGSTSWGGTEFLPYSSASATTCQILPLSVVSSSSSSGGARGPPPVTLAFQHSVSSSTPHLPRHEARAMANTAQIRGASPDGPVAASVRGTTELRLPVSAPLAGGTGTVVLFGDWFYVQPHATPGASAAPAYARSSIGVGLRKTVQGLPLKYDFCYSSEGKFKSMFGLGLDFDV